MACYSRAEAKPAWEGVELLMPENQKLGVRLHPVEIVFSGPAMQLAFPVPLKDGGKCEGSVHILLWHLELALVLAPG